MLYFEVFYILKQYFSGSSSIHQDFSKHSSSLLSYHASLLPNESSLRRVFSRGLLYGKYFLGFLSVSKYFFGSFINNQLRRSLSVNLPSPPPGCLLLAPKSKVLHQFMVMTCRLKNMGRRLCLYSIY